MILIVQHYEDFETDASSVEYYVFHSRMFQHFVDR